MNTQVEKDGEGVEHMERLAHAARSLVSVDAIEAETHESHGDPWQYTWPKGTWRKVLGTDPQTAGSTFLLYLPAGYGRAEEASLRGSMPLGRFETHSCHEEIFNLGGQYSFGEWYSFPEMGYLNHPPHWVHPADQSTSTGVLLLIKNSAPVDFDFSPIPDGWDGIEGIVRATDGIEASTDGVTMLGTSDMPWDELRDANGAETGAHARHLWHDAGTGWSTWMMKAPAGWSSPIARGEKAGGDEMFLLEGDLTHPRHGVMRAQSYYCDPEDIEFGGESTDGGFVAIRWTRDHDHLALPTIQA